MRANKVPVEIDLKQVSEGENSFRIVRPLSAFDLDGTELASESPITIELCVLKTGSAFDVKGTVSLRARLECSRCLRTYEENLSWPLRVLLQRAPRGETLEGLSFFDEDLERIAHHAQSVDLTQRIREALLLALPAKPLCRQDCAGLCAVCGQDLNHGQCSCHTSAVDSRCDGLSKLAGLSNSQTASRP